MKAYDHQIVPDSCWAKAFKLMYKAGKRENRGSGEGKEEKKKKKIFSWAKNKPLLYFEKLQYIMLRGVFL